MTKVQFAFQGGGARLGALLAAAEAVFAQQKALNFTVSRVSGTSAGAIVACVLATGEDPATFRQRLINLADSQLNEICKSYSYPFLGYHLWHGDPLYNTSAYHNFLRDLFDHGTKKWVYLEDLAPNIDIFIHAVDVRTREPVLYKKGDKDSKDNRITIAQALFDSSALPFIFKTFKDKTGIFDGGLVNNFPSDILTAEQDQFGYVAGFSFEPQAIQFEFADAKDFASALISTMMDNATKQSLAKLPTRDVHYIASSTSTLDFRAALNNELKNTATYAKYVADASLFLSNFLDRKRMQVSAVPAAELARRMMHFHEVLRQNQKTRVKKIVLKLKSNSLKIRNLANPASIDEFFLSCEFVAETPVHTFGFRLTIEDKVFNPGDIKPIVLDDEKTSIGVTTLPMSPLFSGSEIPDDNVIMFFHHPLAANKKYKISFSGKAEEILYDMISPKRYDTVRYPQRNMELVEEVDLIAYLPDDISATLTQDAGPLPPGMAWKHGEQLSKGELAEVWNAFPGFYPIGWRGRSVNRGEVIGFRAHYSTEL